MQIITLDFETHFDADYTLSKMSTEEYIRDPRFKSHTVGIKFGDQPAVDFLPHLLHENADLRRAIETSAVLAHHAHFDGLILAHHYRLRPAFWLDTLSIARATVRNVTVGGSLAKLLQHFNLAGKTLNYANFKGVRDLSPTLYAEVAAGCRVDTDQTYELFKRLARGFPPDELKVIDQVTRMFTEPCLELDVPRCTAFLQAERRRKAELMLSVARGWGWPDPTTQEQLHLYLATVETELQSSDKFRAALESMGYECPLKWSDKAKCENCGGHGDVNIADGIFIDCEKCNKTGKGGYIPALAKNDDAMQELLDHDDSRVAGLAAARLGVKSTIDETRAERLLNAYRRGPLPAYLSYGAAETLRFGGGDKTNWQNFRRGGEIRKSIKAPKGYKLLIVDKSQIEYRLLCYVAGQFDKLQALAEGRDLYCEFSSELHGWTVTKDHKAERGIGKQGVLSCLAEGTLTVTSRGAIPIEEVTVHDLLWDGETWVRHSGLINKGLSEHVMNLAGLKLTPDHLVWCGNMFLMAKEAVRENILSRALVSASENLPYQATWSVRRTALNNSWCNVRVGLKSTLLTFGTQSLDVLRDVTTALKKQRRPFKRNIGVMPTLSLMMSIGVASWGAFAKQLIAAPTLTINGGNITADEEFSYSMRGWLTLKNSSRTLSPWTAGITRYYRWIESITTRGMNPATCALLRVVKTWEIGVRWQFWKRASRHSNKKMQLYDIASAGPRNRFTVLTDRGPLIVHNCGYGAGDESIQRTAKLGTYGPPVEITLERGGEIKNLYRRTHPAVPRFWKTCQDVFLPNLVSGGTFDYIVPGCTHPIIRIADHLIWLPNGQFLDFELRYGYFRETPEPGEEPSYWQRTRKGWSRIWGSALTAKIIQALAGVLLRQRMVTVGAKLRTVLQVHDELVFLVPDTEPSTPREVACGEAQPGTWLAWALHEFVQIPPWADDRLVLNAEGKVDEIYSK